jgi:hypothetical protein
LDWIHLAKGGDRWRDLVNTVMNLLIPQRAWNLLTSWATVRFSIRTLFHEVRNQIYKHNLHEIYSEPRTTRLQLRSYKRLIYRLLCNSHRFKGVRKVKHSTLKGRKWRYATGNWILPQIFHTLFRISGVFRQAYCEENMEILIQYVAPLVPSGVMPNFEKRPLTQLAANYITLNSPYY